MTSTYRYIDITSAHRNRNQYPLPTDFVIPISNAGANNYIPSLQAQDPIVLGYPQFTTTTVAGSTTSVINIETGSTINNYYINSLLAINNEYKKVSAYDPTTIQITVTGSFSSAPPAGETVQIVGAIPLLTGAISSATSIMVNLGPTANSTTDYYQGQYLYITSGVDVGKITQISSQTGTVVTLSKNLNNAPSAGDTYQVLAYTNDNLFPMIYPGTIGFSQPVCYAIELINLIIPNVELRSGYGGGFSTLPYLYMKLFNAGNAHTDKTLYSNNPGAENSVFKIPIGLNLLYEPFFCLKDCRQIIVVKFRPNEPLRFTLLDPSGNVIQFLDSDNMSPNPVNPLLQVSATLAIRRLDSSQ